MARKAKMLFVIAGASVALAAMAREWLPLARDGIHDPELPALAILQEPRQALALLPADGTGNMVNWVKSLDEGVIKPRTGVLSDTPITIRDRDVLLKNTGEMPMVRFPHRQHTAWLDCSNCHDKLFQQKAGATKINMAMILRGEKCGVCHGAVSFPITECNRCHSAPRKLGPVEKVASP